MNPVITARFESLQKLDLIQLTIAIAVTDAVKSTLNLTLIIIDPRIEGSIGKHHPVDGPDVHGNLFDLARLQGFSRCRSFEFVEATILVTSVDTSLVIRRQSHPRTLFLIRDRIE